MATCRVGVQLHPQDTSIEALRTAARQIDAAGFDSLWTWDHFFPLYGDEAAAHFEGWTLLTAFAADTEHVTLGHLVTCNSYRNPQLLADMARTVDHISGGRMVLGIGAGWFERDYREYEYAFPSRGGRVRDLEASLFRVRHRMRRLTPPPLGPLPLLIGAGGEQVMLRLVAEHADMWNGFGPPERYAHKMRVLDQWCERVGRDPAAVERTALLHPHEVDALDAYLDAGAQHVILECGAPFDLDPARQLLAAAQRADRVP